MSVQGKIAESGQIAEQTAPGVSGRSLTWKQDSGDFSWSSTDDLGYFYRVTQVHAPRGDLLFACAWTETIGFRQSPYLYSTVEEARARMNSLASFAREVQP